MVVISNRETRIDLTTAHIPEDSIKSGYNRLKKTPTGLTRISSPSNASHVRHQSPWELYRQLYQLKFDDGEQFVVAAKLVSLDENSSGDDNHRVMVKRIIGPNAKDKLRFLFKVHHNHFASVLKVFNAGTDYFVSFPSMPFSLAQVAKNRLLDGICVASILKQILSGLQYLYSIGLEHGQLTCTNILINHKGHIKIWGQEHCRDRSINKQKMRDLADVTMQLVDGDAPKDGKVGIRDLERWQDTEILSFLTEMVESSEITSLLKHRFLQLHSSNALAETALQNMMSLVVYEASVGL